MSISLIRPHRHCEYLARYCKKHPAIMLLDKDSGGHPLANPLCYTCLHEVPHKNLCPFPIHHCECGRAYVIMKLLRHKTRTCACAQCYISEATELTVS